MAYSVDNFGKVGCTGDWKSLGLPPLREIEYDAPIVKTRISDAYRRLRKGEVVINPFGERLHADRRTLAHLAKRGRSQSELAVRLSELDAAEETVRHKKRVRPRARSHLGRLESLPLRRTCKQCRLAPCQRPQRAATLSHQHHE